MGTYKVHDDLKRRIRRAGLVDRDVAHALGEHPKTTNARLNGYMDLNEETRNKIVSTIEKAEAAMRANLQERG